jgi:hypothetical protein
MAQVRMSDKLTTEIAQAVMNPRKQHEHNKQKDQVITKSLFDWILTQEPVANLYKCPISEKLVQLCKEMGVDQRDYLEGNRVRVHLQIVEDETFTYAYNEFMSPYVVKRSSSSSYSRDVRLTLDELLSWGVDPCKQFPGFGDFVSETKKYKANENQRLQLWGAINREIKQVTTANQLVKRYPLVRQFMPQWALEALDRKVERKPRSAEPEINSELNQEMMKVIIGGN